MRGRALLGSALVGMAIVLAAACTPVGAPAVDTVYVDGFCGAIGTRVELQRTVQNFSTSNGQVVPITTYRTRKIGVAFADGENGSVVYQSGGKQWEINRASPRVTLSSGHAFANGVDFTGDFYRNTDLSGLDVVTFSTRFGGVNRCKINPVTGTFDRADAA